MTTPAEDLNPSNVVAFTRSVATVMREMIGKAVKDLADRLNELEQRIAVIPSGPQGEQGARGLQGEKGAQGEKGDRGEAGERGPPGESGANGETGRTGEQGDRGVTGEPGPAGAQGAPGALGPRGEKGDVGAQGPQGLAGERGTIGLTGEIGPQGERGADGIDGKDGVPGLNGKDGAAGLNGKDGSPGRDAIEFEILPAIDARKLYPRGTYATHRGGLWKSFQTTDGMKGWDCLIQGVDGIEVVQLDARNFEVQVQMSVATRTFAFAVPSLIERGVFKAHEGYAQGDGVTYAGAYWIAQCATMQKPGEGNADWRLAVKSGRNGKDGERGPQGVEGKAGRDGRDLTQMGPDGRKW